jgi:hypothetical protein
MVALGLTTFKSITGGGGEAKKLVDKNESSMADGIFFGGGGVT